jgi:hypothetical protein
MMPQSYQGQKVRVTITACDPTNRLIHARFKDGGSTSIAVWEVPQAFRWPQVSEVWTVTKQNGYWILGSRLNDDSAEALPITSLSTDPDLRLDGTTIYDLNGNQVVAVTMSGIQNNYVPIYNVTASGWLVGPSIDTSNFLTTTTTAGGVLTGPFSDLSLVGGSIRGNYTLGANEQGFNYNAVNGDWVIALQPGLNIVLPYPELNEIIAISNTSGTPSQPTLVTISGGASFIGPGVNGAYEFIMGAEGAFVNMQAISGYWYIVGGAQDSGWQTAFTYNNSWATGSSPFAYRLQGNRVSMRGSLNGGAATAATVGIIPANYWPAFADNWIVSTSGIGATNYVSISALGVVTANSYGPGWSLDMAPVSYTVD